MLTLDFANCLSDRVGDHGLDPKLIAPGSAAAERVVRLTEGLENTRSTEWERWRLLPFGETRRDHVKAVHDVVAKCKGRFDNLVVFGIGGSALGNIALQAALNSPQYNLLPDGQRPGPRIVIIDNVDPVYVSAALDACRAHGGIERTLFNVISKSGETAETASQFMIARKLLIDAVGEEKHAEHIVAITDPEKGTMRSICDAAGYTTLPVPEGVGGRFSVLSPVGLFSAAMAGIDIEQLLSGAASMDELCSRPAIVDNPAAMLATLLVHLGEDKHKTNHVLMPYANQLYLLADWFRQLWAESLGKKEAFTGEEVYAGFTPIKALGTTDQHSQVQLYREGPNDKVIGFLEVEEFETDLTIPSGLGVEATSYLEGQSMTRLLNAEKRATEFALVESQRPNFTLKFPTIDAFHVGAFLALWEITTAYAGLMLNIDAYDQPAVETGKVATFGLMGRPGYDEWKQKVDARLTPTLHRIG